MFDFRQLRYFVAVAEELSFTRAAIRLHISQPPLSQQIQSLERELGTCLLERSKRRVALTEPGRVFLDEARQILARAEQARGRTAAAAAGRSGRLRLAYTPSVSFHPALPRILRRHRQAIPGVIIQLEEMDSEAQFAALLANEIDVGFVRDTPHHQPDVDRLQLHAINHEPLLLAIPAQHPLATRDHLAMIDVAEEGFITQLHGATATLHHRLMALAGKAGFEPRVVQQVQQINGMLALVAAEMGVALMPATMRVVDLPGVSYVPVADHDASLLLAVASRADDVSPVLRQFLATMAACTDAEIGELQNGQSRL